MPLSIERDTAKRTILVLHERRSPDARGLETKQRHPSLVNDVGTVRVVFIQVGEAIRRFACGFARDAARETASERDDDPNLIRVGDKISTIRALFC